MNKTQDQILRNLRDLGIAEISFHQWTIGDVAQSDLVVYTAHFGSLASLQDVSPISKNKVYFIALIDSAGFDALGWNIIRITLPGWNARIANRRIKFPGRQLFGEVTKTIYVDSNISITKQLCLNWKSVFQKPLMFHKHPRSKTLEMEIRNNAKEGKQKINLLIKHACRYRGYLNLNVSENCVVFRDYSNQVISKFDTMTFMGITKGPARDQLWTPIILNHLGQEISYGFIGQKWRDNDYFVYNYKGLNISRFRAWFSTNIIAFLRGIFFLVGFNLVILYEYIRNKYNDFDLKSSADG